MRAGRAQVVPYLHAPQNFPVVDAGLKARSTRWLYPRNFKLRHYLNAFFIIDPALLAK